MPRWLLVLIGLAAVAVVVILLQQNALTGRYHIPGGSDYVKLVNISFSPQVLNVSENGTSRTVVAIRTSISGSGELTFKFGSTATRTAYFVVRNLTQTDQLMPGAIFYYEPSASTSGPSSTISIARRGFIGYRPNEYFFPNDVIAWLYVNKSVSNPATALTITLGNSPSPYPRAVNFTMRDYDTQFTYGYWITLWNTGVPYSPPAAPVALRRQSYLEVGGVYRNIRPIFTSRTGTTLLQSTTSQVVIQRAYDVRLD